MPNNPSTQKLQKAIIQRLNLSVEGISSIKGKAQRISEELERKKCLILLDKVGHKIDLHKIMGFQNLKDNKVKICLLMMLGTCFEIVGDALSSSSIKRIASDRVAITFKKNEENDVLWNRGLMCIQRWDSSKVGGIDEVLEFLELYYLLECWRAEGFTMDYTNEFKDARGKGHAILKELIDLSLLEITDGRKFVKMNKLLVKPREGLNDFPKKEKWEQATRISLMDNQLQTLPDTDLDCRNLLTLLLQRNW
ncbi:hypothetical protein AAG906_003880 [Vitis piasezkii]